MAAKREMITPKERQALHPAWRGWTH